MKRKLIKYGILGIIVVLIGWNLSQCTGGNPGNMRQYEIINKIKEKMKAEMDRIDFEVNFDDYEFKVKPLQSFGDYGSVTIKDKRYNYDPITIYDGSLQQLEQEKIGTNPIVFVGHGYQDYVDNVLLNDKARGNNLNEALRVSEGKKNKDMQEVVTVGTTNEVFGYNISIEKMKNTKGNGNYYILPYRITSEEYQSFFKGKKSREMNYSDFVEKMNYIVVVVINTNKTITEELNLKIQEYYNSESVIFVLKEGV